MRIIFIAHRLPFPPNKGEKIRAFGELVTLSKQHEIDLFCFYDDPNDRKELSSLCHYCQQIYMEPVHWLGSRLRAVYALLAGQPFSPAFFYSDTMALNISRAIESRHYDLMFVFGSSMAKYALARRHLPKILDFVDVDSDKWTQYAVRSRGPLSWLWKIEGKRLEAYEAKIAKEFTRCLVCTDPEAQLLRSKASEGLVDVIENFLDTAYFSPDAVSLPKAIRELQPYVVFSGTMDYFPNIDAVQFFCSDVLPLVRAQAPQLRFVIAGRNPSRAVRALAAIPGIVVTGSVSDIRPYLLGARAAVAPMRVARGVQNKILEALAMDVPVVASSMAAAALPREIASVLARGEGPESLAARVLECFFASVPPKGRLRSVLTRYLEEQDIPSQLERIVCDAVALNAEKRRPQVGVAV